MTELGAISADMVSFGQPSAAQDTRPVVDPPVGAISGVFEADGIRVFRGIPYAVAPTGALRWKPPVPALDWTDTRAASEFGPACVQPKSPLGSIYADDPPVMSEDCLSLNVWAAEGARQAPGYRLLWAVIGAGCRAAIKLSEKI